MAEWYAVVICTVQHSCGHTRWRLALIEQVILPHWHTTLVQFTCALCRLPFTHVQLPKSNAHTGYTSLHECSCFDVESQLCLFYRIFRGLFAYPFAHTFKISGLMRCWTFSQLIDWSIGPRFSCSDALDGKSDRTSHALHKTEATFHHIRA